MNSIPKATEPLIREFAGAGCSPRLWRGGMEEYRHDLWLDRLAASRLYRGREDGLTSPLPPNRTSGSPASGSPVSGSPLSRAERPRHGPSSG